MDLVFYVRYYFHFIAQEGLILLRKTRNTRKLGFFYLPIFNKRLTRRSMGFFNIFIELR
jgi:hypothetical protein